MRTGQGVTALSSGLRAQEVAWSRDLNPAKPPELEQVVVTGDDRLGSGGEGALEDSMGWTRTVTARMACIASRARGVDQRNLRIRTPSVSSRIAREMQSSMRPARPRARTASATMRGTLPAAAELLDGALDVGLGHPEFSRPTGTVAPKPTPATLLAIAAQRLAETSVFVRPSCLASRSASRTTSDGRESERTRVVGISAVLG